MRENISIDEVEEKVKQNSLERKIRLFVMNLTAIILITLIFTFIIKSIEVRTTLTNIQTNSSIYLKSAGIEYLSSGKMAEGSALDYLKYTSCKILLDLGERSNIQVFFIIFLIVNILNIIGIAVRKTEIKKGDDFIWH